MAKGKKQTNMQKRATPYELGFAQNGQAMQANNSNKSAQKGSSLTNWLCTNLYANDDAQEGQALRSGFAQTGKGL